MKANLAQAEPQRLERWKAEDLYGQVRAAAEGRAELRPPRRPALRQRPHPPRHRAQQDPEGPGRAQPLDGRPRRALRARLGLPRPADRAAGRQGPGPKKKRDVAGRVPPGLPRVRREVRRRSSATSSSGSASWASGTTPYLTMAPGYQATIVRQLADVRREGARLQGQEVGPLVHLVPHGAGRGRGRVRRAPRSPSIDVRFPLGRGRARQARGALPGARRQARLRRRSGPRRPGRCPRTWRSPSIPRPTTPSTRSRGRTDVLLLAKALRSDARADAGWRAAALGAPLAEAKGADARGRALPPSLDRPRLAGRPRRLRHPRHRHRRRAHGARPRLGRLPDRRRATASTSTARSTRRAASCPRSSASPASRSSTPTRR